MRIEDLQAQAALWAIALNERQLGRLQAFAELLASYDEANVIGVRDQAQILEGHVLDSLSCFAAQVFEDGASVVDVGTGGGFPASL